RIPHRERNREIIMRSIGIADDETHHVIARRQGGPNRQPLAEWLPHTLELLFDPHSVTTGAWPVSGANSMDQVALEPRMISGTSSFAIRGMNSLAGISATALSGP